MYYPIGLLLGIMVGAIHGAMVSPQSPQEEPRATFSQRRPTNSARPAANLRLDVSEILVPVTVTDPLDRPINTLPQTSFRLTEDGVAQKITSFSVEDAPVSLGLLFDSSGSMKGRIDASVEALKLLFQTTIPGDEFFVVQFADQARLLGGFTPDATEIQNRLGFVEAKGWTALLDALALGTHEMRTAKNRRRVLLVLSDGNDNNSRFSEAEIRRIVVEADLRIYGIGLYHKPRLLEQLAEETGGSVLLAQNVSELPDVVEKMSREIRSQYLIGYSSTNFNRDGKFRKVKVELVPSPGGPPLHVSWRRGYYAPAQ